MNTKFFSATAALFIAATTFANAGTFAVQTQRDAPMQSAVTTKAQMPMFSGAASMSDATSNGFVETTRDSGQR